MFVGWSLRRDRQWRWLNRVPCADRQAKALPRIVLLTGAFLLTYVGLEVRWRWGFYLHKRGRAAGTCTIQE